jgi:NurA-like 5'-3' nuclease
LADHPVAFFYLNIAGDIARVELPAWAATPPQVERLHSALVDQCARCGGYPRALQEAHEQAVISASDRAAFARLLERESLAAGLAPAAGGKAASKRRRAV